MKATLTTMLSLGLLVHTGSAEAKPKAAKTPAAAADDADADDAARVAGRSRITEYNFDNEDVDGLVLRPEGTAVPASARARFPSLLSIRGLFTRELVRMARDL